MTRITNLYVYFFFFNDTATTEIYTLSLHDALPIPARERRPSVRVVRACRRACAEQVARDVEAAVRAVLVGIVSQGLRDAEPVEVLAVDHATAGAHVRGDVEV